MMFIVIPVDAIADDKRAADEDDADTAFEEKADELPMMRTRFSGANNEG
jgi:hypothetical protein